MTCTETRASQVRLKQKHEWQTAWKLNVTEVEKLNVVKEAVEKTRKLFVTWVEKLNVVKAAVEKKRKLFVTEVEKLNDVKAAVEKKMKLFVTICIGRLSYDCAPVAIYGAGVEPLV